PLLAHSLYSDIPSPPPIDTLSLHDALPIFLPQDGPAFQHCRAPAAARAQYRRQAEQPASAGLRYAPARALLHPGFAYAQSSDAAVLPQPPPERCAVWAVCGCLLPAPWRLPSAGLRALPPGWWPAPASTLPRLLAPSPASSQDGSGWLLPGEFLPTGF